MAVFRGALIEDASAGFRRQHQKLRPAGTGLLAEFRGQARLPSMRAPSETVFFSIYRFFNIILTTPGLVSGYGAAREILMPVHRSERSSYSAYLESRVGSIPKFSEKYRGSL